MRNFRIVIQYEGTRYQGWQRQGTTQNTLQGKFEALLSKIAGTPVEIQASGRTDAGVHALGQTANFHMNTDCLLYTSDAADEEDSGDFGGRRVIKKKTKKQEALNYQAVYKQEDINKKYKPVALK